MKPVAEKSHLYRTISTLNRAFSLVLEKFDDLDGLGVFRSKYIRMFKNKACELQAQANEEILETLKDREEADWEHFGGLVRAFEKQYEDSTELVSRENRHKRSRSPRKPRSKG